MDPLLKLFFLSKLLALSPSALLVTSASAFSLLKPEFMIGWVLGFVGAIFLWLAIFGFYKLISRLVEFLIYGKQSGERCE